MCLPNDADKTTILKNNYYYAIFEFSQDAIFIETFDGQIVDVNSAACKLLQYTREELLTMNVVALLPQDEQQPSKKRLYHEWITEGRSFVGHNIRKDGSRIPVEVRMNDFWQDDKRYMIVSVRDITKRMEEEEKIRGQNQFFLAMNQVSIGLLSRLDRDDILRSVLTHAGKLFDTPDVCIALLSNDHRELEQKLGIGRYADFFITFKPGEGLIGKVWQKGQSLVIENYKTWEGRLHHPFADIAQMCVAIPLKLNGNIIGVIGMDFYDQPRAFSEEDMQMLGQFAQVASIALVNAELYTSLAKSEKALQEKNIDLSAAYEELMATEEELRAAHEELIASENELRQQFYALLSKEEKIRCLSLYDSMTGVYNRSYFEEALKRIEGAQEVCTGLIIFDLDGLKLINDTLGHNAGDLSLKAVAQILKDYFKNGDLVARIGGDEFAVLLHNSAESRVQTDCSNIRKQVDCYNMKNPTVPISVSMGFAVNCKMPIDMKAIFDEADNNMYREKLHRSKSSRSAIVQALITALEARDFQTEGHSDRLEQLMGALAIAMNVSEQQLSDLRLFARFHDIGKVGIPDHILFKPGKLTDEEYTIMRQHSDIGHRIALSAPDLVPIADWILKHHERWDGSGYPLGLGEVEIPLACRMLGIIDAYDAMISDRPYRKAMSHQEAVVEIRRCSGTQFDPSLVEVFTTLLHGVLKKEDE